MLKDIEGGFIAGTDSSMIVEPTVFLRPHLLTYFKGIAF